MKGKIDWATSVAAAYWNRRIWDFDQLHPRLILIRNLIDTILKPGSQLLDVGCGAATFRRILQHDIEYFGVDIAGDAIESFHDPIHFEAIDFNVNPECFSDKKFDIVVCSGVFEYVQQPDRFIEFLGQKLVDAGHLILTYTNRQHYLSVRNWLRGGFDDNADPHSNSPTIPQAVDLLAANGFKISRHVAVTNRRKRQLPFLHRYYQFPFNALFRQYIFLCGREKRC